MKSGIGKRLLSASKLVRQGAYFADIGTDHAYLPLFLLEQGKISGAVCADINEGPLKSAMRNAEECGLADKITFKLTDGAAGLSNMGITDYAICGMGGELIAKIILNSPHLKDEKVRLILQPMSKQGYLRRMLAASGFSTVGEAYSYDAGKYYLCLAVEYDGIIRSISDIEAELGSLPALTELTHEQKGYLNQKLRALEKIAKGKTEGGEENSPEARMLEEYKAQVERNAI